MNTRSFSIFICVLVVFTLAACDLLPSNQPLVVPLPTYATGGPTRNVTAATAPPSNTRAPSPTIDPNFWSNGAWVTGWYWIRDDAYKTGANWFIDIPAGTGDVKFNLTVLATNAANGGRGVNAVFYLTWGQAGGSQTEGTAYGRKRIELPNTSPASDPVGYTCTGTVTLTRAEIQNSTKLWLSATRQDPKGEGAPSTVHVAFNKQSIVVVK